MKKETNRFPLIPCLYVVIFWAVVGGVCYRKYHQQQQQHSKIETNSKIGKLTR